MARRTLCSLIAAGAVLALTGCAGQDSVIFSGGPGQTADGGFRVQKIYAVSGPSGESAGGRVLLELRVIVRGAPTYVEVGGPVTCLAVDGSTAILNFDEQLLDIGVVTITVHDGNPDTFASGLIQGRAATDCSSPNLTEQPLTSGHISIVDSPPAPGTR